MPTSHENALQQRCQQIVTSPVLSPEQKRHFLALEAENNLPYPQLPAEARRALDEGVICDMFEGHAPYKPRYVLPDYARFLANGSEWLELEGAKDLDDALSLLPYMGDVFRGDVAFEKRVAHLITSCHVRETDSEERSASLICFTSWIVILHTVLKLMKIC